MNFSFIEDSRKNIILHEARLLYNLAAFTLVLEIGATFAPFLITSRVGTQLGKTALSGLSLASVVSNLGCASFINGLMTASDTLSPQAFGCGNKRELGLIAIRAFFAVMAVVIPCQLVTYFKMTSILSFLGEEDSSVDLAFKWYRLYLLGVPFRILYVITWKFLAAQEIMIPLASIASLVTFVILPILLEYFLTTMGFVGSSIANSVYQIILASTLLFYLSIAKPYYEQTWPGLSAWREALRWEPFLQFFRLGLGGLLPISEWWCWEFIILIAGTMGIVALNVHTIAATVITVGFQIPFGIGGALTVRLGATLPKNVPRAKKLVIGCYLATAFIIGTICSLLYIYRYSVYSLFTSDEEVIEGCEEIWLNVVLGYFSMSFFAMNLCVMNGLGLQWSGGAIIFFYLWFVNLPMVYYPAVVQKEGVKGIWKGLLQSYTGLVAVFFIYFSHVDWDDISKQINQKLGVKDCVHTPEAVIKYGSINAEC